MYPLFRKAAFLLSAETAHELTIDALSAVGHLKLTNLMPQPKQQKSVNVFGIEFPNAVGLAAGLDKNGDAIDALGALGFGFIEVGTVTPEPQPGNPTPRLFRIPEKEAIINRMGFNNKGVDYLVSRIRKSTYSGVIGVNIGKNKVTPEEEAVNDYLICLEKVYEVADYIVINLSSPNTPGLRNLQFGENLSNLIRALKERQASLDEQFEHTPVLIKIAPDLDEDDIVELTNTFNELKVEGVIATNTTISREQVEGCQFSDEQGGLSGTPVRDMSNQVLKRFRELLDDSIPLIGVGGIMSERDAEEKLTMGADLVQIYTGFIYQGPGLIKRTVERLARM
ncbi:quinone-dependent dihydroorotate dehydrogenase [Reinekea blandensis]|uniref:Dihydroorotate dehydrogenase (quinone) n=1 Tax=Reinekea blandensis MED297 TaxID=314283 RepID=A4BHI1_9GAMM|nr:quinone-dependent dihydroorotate dehydrogenase [Reinekea blandensis]EAR08379.1 dihydroorotate dehydrogenase [Reinekea blandensis MED297]